MEIGLIPRSTTGSLVVPAGSGWRLEIPSGARGSYRLAQLDDYSAVSRRHFPHTSPRSVNLLARVSAVDLPGTWGFGLWNDPFGFSLGFGGTPGRLPALPNATWFFHASPPNWLSLHDGIPAHGFFAGTVRSPHLSSLLLSPGLLALPFLGLRSFSRLLRRLACQVVRQDAATPAVDVIAWHAYTINWLCDSTAFLIDGQVVLHSSNSPASPLGLVLWIDNQYAAWTPQGRLGYGTLPNPPAWLEIGSLEISDRTSNDPY